MDYEKLIRELVNNKAEQDNQIDLHAYENGMRAFAEALSIADVSSMLVANGMPAFGTKEFNDMCSNFFGGKPKSN